MRFFKKGQQKEGNTRSGKDKLAKGIVKVIATAQNSFATFMNKRTNNLSLLSMKWMLIFFTLTGSGLSIYLIVLAVLKKKNVALKIDRISVPKYYNKNGDAITIPDVIILPKEHEEMQRFQNYMDSLRTSKNGKPIYDSIIMNRPGLLDSVRMLEEIYQSQNKK